MLTTGDRYDWNWLDLYREDALPAVYMYGSTSKANLMTKAGSPWLGGSDSSESDSTTSGFMWADLANSAIETSDSLFRYPPLEFKWHAAGKSVLPLKAFLRIADLPPEAERMSMCRFNALIKNFNCPVHFSDTCSVQGLGGMNYGTVWLPMC